jgi:hypothetical protein
VSAQQRLERPGAWWRVEHVLALRILRINGDWDAYWDKLGGKAAPRQHPEKAENS